MSEYREMLLPFGNEKAPREQGPSILPATPTKALKGVCGEYQSFSELAINCLQFIEHEPFHASLRIAPAKRYSGLRVSINGRDGRAACFLTNAQQIDDLIDRLEKLKVDTFGKCVGVVE